MTNTLLSLLLIVETVGSIIAMDRLTSRHNRQVAELCQRIQAPDTAVAMHAVHHMPDQPMHLPWGDDQAFIKYEQELNGAKA